MIGLLLEVFGGGGGDVATGLATTGFITLASNLSKVVEPCDPPTPSSKAEKGGERISIIIDLLACFEVVEVAAVLSSAAAVAALALSKVAWAFSRAVTVCASGGTSNCSNSLRTRA